MIKKIFSPIHPGEVLKKELMEPLNVTAYRLSKDTGLSPIAVSHLVRRKRGISVDIAIRLEKYFGISAECWLNLQARYEIENAREKDKGRYQNIVAFKEGKASSRKGLVKKFMLMHKRGDDKKIS